MGRDPVSEALCSFVFFRVPDDGQSPKPINPENSQRLYVYYNVLIHLVKRNPDFIDVDSYNVCSAPATYIVNMSIRLK
jgi:hypothetical protein